MSGCQDLYVMVGLRSSGTEQRGFALAVPLYLAEADLGGHVGPRVGQAPTLAAAALALHDAIAHEPLDRLHRLLQLQRGLWCI